eukprot:tig00021137_g18982.t1
MAEYDHAIRSTLEALEQARKNEDEYDIESNLQQLGRLYAEHALAFDDEKNRQKLLKKAIERHREELKYAEKRGPIFTGYTHEKLGSCTFELEDFRSALRHYENELDAAFRADSNLEQMKALYNIHRALVRLGRPEEAACRLREALELRGAVRPAAEAAKHNAEQEKGAGGKKRAALLDEDAKARELDAIAGKVVVGLHILELEDTPRALNLYDMLLNLLNDASERGTAQGSAAAREAYQAAVAEMNRDAAAAFAEAAAAAGPGGQADRDLQQKAAIHFENAAEVLVLCPGEGKVRAAQVFELACGARVRCLQFEEATAAARRVDTLLVSAPPDARLSARLLREKADAARLRWREARAAYGAQGGPRLRDLVLTLERIERLLPYLVADAADGEAEGFERRLERDADGLLEAEEEAPEAGHEADGGEARARRAAALRCAAAVLSFRRAAAGEVGDLSEAAGRVEGYAEASGLEAARAYGLAAAAVAAARAPSELYWQVPVLLRAEECIRIYDALSLNDDRLEADALEAYQLAFLDPNRGTAEIEATEAHALRRVQNAEARLAAAQERITKREADLARAAEAEERPKRRRAPRNLPERGTDGDSERIFGRKEWTGEEGDDEAMDLEERERAREQRARLEADLWKDEAAGGGSSEEGEGEELGATRRAAWGRKRAAQGRHDRAAAHWKRAADKFETAGDLENLADALRRQAESHVRSKRGKASVVLAARDKARELLDKSEGTASALAPAARALHTARVAITRGMCEVLVIRRSARRGREELERIRPMLDHAVAAMEKSLRELLESGVQGPKAARARIDLRLQIADARIRYGQRGTLGVGKAKKREEEAHQLAKDLEALCKEAAGVGYVAAAQRAAYLRARALALGHRYPEARNALQAVLADREKTRAGLTDKEARHAQRFMEALRSLLQVRITPDLRGVDAFRGYHARCVVLAGPAIRDEQSACAGLIEALKHAREARKAGNAVPPLELLRAQANLARLRVAIARQLRGEFCTPAERERAEAELRAAWPEAEEAAAAPGGEEGDGGVQEAALLRDLCRLTAVDARVILSEARDRGQPPVDPGALPVEAWNGEKLLDTLRSCLGRIEKVLYDENAREARPFRGPLARQYRLVEARRRGRWLLQEGYRRLGDEAAVKAAEQAAKEAEGLEAGAESSDSEEEVQENDVEMADAGDGEAAARGPAPARRPAAAGGAPGAPGAVPGSAPAQPGQESMFTRLGPRLTCLACATQHNSRPMFGPYELNCCGFIICLSCYTKGVRKCPGCQRREPGRRPHEALDRYLRENHAAEYEQQMANLAAEKENVIRAAPKSGAGARPRAPPPQQQPAGTGPPCPKCAVPLVERTSSTEKNKGRKYWACPTATCDNFKFTNWCDEPMRSFGQRSAGGAGAQAQGASQRPTQFGSA